MSSTWSHSACTPTPATLAIRSTISIQMTGVCTYSSLTNVMKGITNVKCLLIHRWSSTSYSTSSVSTPFIYWAGHKVGAVPSGRTGKQRGWCFVQRETRGHFVGSSVCAFQWRSSSWSPSVPCLSRRAQYGRRTSFGTRVWFTESHPVLFILFSIIDLFIHLFFI